MGLKELLTPLHNNVHVPAPELYARCGNRPTDIEYMYNRIQSIVRDDVKLDIEEPRGHHDCQSALRCNLLGRVTSLFFNQRW